MKASFWYVLWLWPSLVHASPVSLSYQGRILNTNGQPLEYPAVSFEFRITSPNGACLIYREQKNGTDMSNSKGMFDTPIGMGTKLYPSDPLFTIADALENAGTFPCEGGGSYSPSVDDERKLRVQFHDGQGWKLISPDNVIRSVPYALHAAQAGSARTLGTNVATDFVLKTGVPLCASGFVLTSMTAGVLSCVADASGSSGTVSTIYGTSPIVATNNGGGTYTISASVGTTSGTLAAGNDARITNALQSGATAGGDLSGTYPSPSVTRIAGTGLSMTSLTSGQFLKYNGTNWINAGISTADISGMTSYLTQSAFTTAVTPAASCSTSQSMYWNSVSSTFACQSISVSSFSGSLVGDVSGTQGATVVDRIKGVGIDFSTAPTSGQVLRYNGTNWAPASPSAGTVTTVSGSAPLSVTNASTTPSITIAQATTSTSGYLSSTDWNAFNGKQNPATSLSGYGILDAVRNNGGSPGIQSGADTSKPASPTAGTIYFATDTNRIYQFNSGAWASVANEGAGGGSGSVTSVATGTGLTGGPITSSGTIAVDVGTTANKIPQLDGSGKLATSTLPTSVITSSSTLGGDLSGTLPNPTVARINGITVDFTTAPTNGQVLRYNGTSFVPSSTTAGTVTSVSASGPLSVTNGTTTPAVSITQANTTTAGYLTAADWNTFNGKGTMTSVIAGTGLTGGTITTTGTIAVDVGTTANKIPQLDGSGKLAASTLPSAVVQTSTTLGGDLSGTLPNPTVARINGITVDFSTAPTSGQVLRYNGTNFAPSSTTSGTVTSVATGTGLTGGPISSTGTISIANGGVDTTQLADGAVTQAKLATIGGLTAGAYGSGTAVPTVTVDTKGRVTAISTTNISSVPTPSGASGKFLRSDGSAWSGQFILFSDIKNSTGTSAFNVGSCAANQTVAWSSLTDTFGCQNIGSLSASVLTGGTLNAGRLPALTGDITTTAGSAATTLANSGVTVGTYSKVTVDAKGRVTVGADIASADVTTALGYTPVNRAGDTMTGNLRVPVANVDSINFIRNNSAPAAYDAVKLSTYAYNSTPGSEGTGITIRTKVSGTDTAIADFADYSMFYTPAEFHGNWSYFFRGGTNASGPFIYGQKYRGTISSKTAARSGDDLLTIAGLGQSASNNALPGAYIYMKATQDYSSSAAGGKIVFSTTADNTTNPTDRMTIDQTGNVAINMAPGTTYKFQVAGSVAGTGAYNATSDRRLKKNIAIYENGLQTILNLRGVQYDWRRDEYPQFNLESRHDVGVIAQEVEAVVPEAVTTGDDGFKTVAYSKLIAPIIEAIKELYVNHKNQERSLASVNEELLKVKTENSRLKDENKSIKAWICQQDPTAPVCR